MKMGKQENKKKEKEQNKDKWKVVGLEHKTKSFLGVGLTSKPMLFFAYLFSFCSIYTKIAGYICILFRGRGGRPPGRAHP